MDQPEQTKTFPRLFGGAPCLDFVNTLNGHRTVYQPQKHVQPYEALHDYGDLVAWCRQAGLVAADEASRLLAAAARGPRRARAALKRALGLRETLYRIFASLALGQTPAATDIARLNQARWQTLARSRIVWTVAGFKVAGHSRPAALDDLLAPVILSAADLLTSDQLEKLRQCAGDTCEWLFLDTSRNHLRRWCSMQACGQRAKSRRQYARMRGRAKSA